ncbi:MAG: hypothetical protein [Cotesia congregata filamentous virus 2]
MGSSLSITTIYDDMDNNNNNCSKTHVGSDEIDYYYKPKKIIPYSWYGKPLSNESNELFFDLKDLQKKTGHRIYLIDNCTQIELDYFINSLYNNKIIYCQSNEKKMSQNTISYIIKVTNMDILNSLIDDNLLKDKINNQGFDLIVLQSHFLFFYEKIFVSNITKDESIICLYRTLDSDFKDILLDPFVITLNCMYAFNIPSQISIDKNLKVSINLPQTALCLESLSIPPNAKFVNVIHYEHAPVSCTNTALCDNKIHLDHKKYSYDDIVSNQDNLIIFIINPNCIDIINFIEQLYVYNENIIFIMTLHLPTITINNTKIIKFIDRVVHNFKYKSKKIAVFNEYVIYLFHNKNFEIINATTLLIDDIFKIYITDKDSADNIKNDDNLIDADLILNIFTENIENINSLKINKYPKSCDIFGVDFEKKIIIFTT